MRALLPCLLLSFTLGAQEEPAVAHRLGINPSLGTDPLTQIQLFTPGCWEGLVQARTQRQPAPPRGQAGATVEVWDAAFQESPRQEGFHLFNLRLRQRLSRAFEVPPPSHAAIELADLMAGDPASPQKLDLTKVKSMQERYNVLPPDGSPVKR